LLTLNALTAADSVMIPVQCEYFALEGLGQLLNTIKIVRQHLNPQLELEGALAHEILRNNVRYLMPEMETVSGKPEHSGPIPSRISGASSTQ